MVEVKYDDQMTINIQMIAICYSLTVTCYWLVMYEQIWSYFVMNGLVCFLWSSKVFYKFVRPTQLCTICACFFNNFNFSEILFGKYFLLENFLLVKNFWAKFLFAKFFWQIFLFSIFFCCNFFNWTFLSAKFLLWYFCDSWNMFKMILRTYL